MTQPSTAPQSSHLSHRIDGGGWALAFIWVGVALLADVGWGWLLIGLGLITLAGQGALRLAHAPSSGFWVAGGALLLGSGIWQLLELRWPLAPVLFILVGLGILVGALAPARDGAKRRQEP
jgi:hypothetical protein